MSALRRGTPRVATALAVLALVLGLSAPVMAPAEAGRSHYNLARASMPGKDPVLRWDPCQRITFKVNPRYAASTTRGRTAAVADVRGAVRRLHRATGFRFRFEGRTRHIPRDTSAGWYDRLPNTEVVVAWVRQDRAGARSNKLSRAGSGWVAGTGGYSYYTGKRNGRNIARIGRGFVVLDAGQRRLFRPGFGSGSRRGSLLLHELGHVMGLEHVRATSELMYPTILRRVRSSYRSGDRAGLARVGNSSRCGNISPKPLWKQQ
jgi:hypothetical protein